MAVRRRSTRFFPTGGSTSIAVAGRKRRIGIDGRRSDTGTGMVGEEVGGTGIEIGDGGPRMKPRGC
jgi:hypothetical protein